jgi:hypothetical protein
VALAINGCQGSSAPDVGRPLRDEPGGADGPQECVDPRFDKRLWREDLAASKALDQSDLPSIAGTVCGDDTIFVACRSESAAADAARDFKQAISGDLK